MDDQVTGDKVTEKKILGTFKEPRDSEILKELLVEVKAFRKEVKSGSFAIFIMIWLGAMLVGLFR